jgi:hypothetical protein
MLDSLMEKEADIFLQENPTPLSVYEIDVVKEVEPYHYFADADAVIVELDKVIKALERELAVS